MFETAKVYLPKGENEIPDQPTKLAFFSERDFIAVKGVVETMLNMIDPTAKLTIGQCSHDVFDISQSAELKIGDQVLGWIGAVSKKAKKQFGIRGNATVAELDISVLESQAVLIPRHQETSAFPPVSRDFNFIVDNAVHWADLEATVRNACGDLLESIQYRETFRDEKRDGPNKKRLLMSVVLRSSESTLTGQQAEEICSSIVSSCETKHSASLVG